MNIIKRLNIDTSSIPNTGAIRRFEIEGDNDSNFNLLIRYSRLNQEYDFKSQTFKDGSYSLSGTIKNGKYIGVIKFPSSIVSERFDIFLLALHNTKHDNYQEARDDQGNINKNASIGSNSDILAKEIHLLTPETLGIKIKSSAETGFTSMVKSEKSIPIIGSSQKVPFEISLTTAAGKVATIDRQPLVSDIYTSRAIVVEDPVLIPGEEQYPTAPGGSKVVSYTTSATVNGDFSAGSGTDITVDQTASSVANVGDSLVGIVSSTTTHGANIYTGTLINLAVTASTVTGVGWRVKTTASDGLFNNNFVTVTELAVEGDVTVIGISHSLSTTNIPSGSTIYFYSPHTYWDDFPEQQQIATVTATPSTNVIRFDHNIAVFDNATIYLASRRNHRFEVTDAFGLQNGMVVDASTAETNTTSGSAISNFTTNLGSEENPQYQIVPGVELIGEKTATYNRGVATFTQKGLVTFNEQQTFAFANGTKHIYAYGVESIKSISGWDVSITDLAAKITKPTTTTTAAVINHTSVPVASGRGIMDGDVSIVTSNNITGQNTVTTIASYNESSNETATLTLSSAVTLDNGETLTFDNASRTITITGNININKAGAGIAGDGVLDLYFDIDRFLTSAQETA